MTIENQNTVKDMQNAIEFDMRNNGAMREYLAGETYPLTIQKIHEAWSYVRDERAEGSIDSVVDVVGWPMDGDRHDKLIWTQSFVGEHADEEFRKEFCSDNNSLSNFLALFKQAPALDSGVYTSFIKQFNATRPAINRLFALDPQLVKLVGQYAQSVRPGVDSAHVARFDTVAEDGEVTNPVVTLLRQAYMIYGRLVMPVDEINHYALNGMAVDPTALDSYKIRNVNDYIAA